MKKAWLSGLLNFVLMGAGYIYNGKKALLGACLTLVAIGLTYIENVHVFGDGNTLQAHDSTVFLILFGCVFIGNTALAIDGYREAKEINSKS